MDSLHREGLRRSMLKENHYGRSDPGEAEASTSRSTLSQPRLRKRQRRSSPPVSQLKRQSSAASIPGVSTLNNGTRVVLNHGYSAGELVYTMPIRFQNGQILPFQLDTGSGDLWVASTACDAGSCSPNEGRPVVKYNETDLTESSQPFSISYLSGQASGNVVRSDLTVGATAIANQAFGSVSKVTNEQMGTGNFSGVCGLSLPANSIISNTTYNVDTNPNPENNAKDPSQSGSVLAGLWGNASAGTRYFGLGLQRLPSNGGAGESVLTFNAVDPAYVSDASQIKYSPVQPGADGRLTHWTSYLTDLLVTVNGTQTSIPLGPSSVNSNAQYPIVAFDSGAGLNLGPVNILNAIYGAYGYGPAADGSGGYYVPCDVPLNITLLIGGAIIPIHPLDATLLQYDTTGRPACLGSFQALQTPPEGQTLPGDFILSVPFLRNVWSVYTCDPILTSPPSGDAPACNPLVGLAPTLRNATQAADEFHRVRVLGQSLGDDNALNGSTDSTMGGKGLSNGVKIVIGCIAAIVVIALLMGGALFMLKRRSRRLGLSEKRAAAGSYPLDGKGDGSDLGGFGTDTATEQIALHRTTTAEARAELSANQQAKQRQLQLIHGVFDEGEDEGTYALAAPAHLRPPSGVGAGWDVTSTSSTGYADARKVRKDYLRRHPSLDGELGQSTGSKGSAGVGAVGASGEPLLSPTSDARSSGPFATPRESISASNAANPLHSEHDLVGGLIDVSYDDMDHERSGRRQNTSETETGQAL